MLAASALLRAYLQTKPLHPGNHRTDGRDRRWLANNHHSYRFFTGGVLTVQTFPTLKDYGAQSQTGYLVAVSTRARARPRVVRVDGDGKSRFKRSPHNWFDGVSQQSTPCRALGTDPIRKLVAPRCSLASELAVVDRSSRRAESSVCWVTAVFLYSVFSSVLFVCPRRHHE